MRIRKRYAIMFAIGAMIVGVVTFQAITATPPEPYVRLVGDGRPNPPYIRTECREDGHFWRVYTASNGEEIDMPTSFDCPN